MWLSKTGILHEADRCDMLGQKEITFLTTTPFATIQASFAHTRQLITLSLQKRYACYQDVLRDLERLLTAQQTQLAQQPLNVPALQQWQVDNGLKDTLMLRQTISQELLLNILRDLERTPSDAAFMNESPKTKALRRQDMETLLDHTRRQLDLDAQRLWAGDPTPYDLLHIKLALASNNLSQAQQLYDSDLPPTLLTARLATLLASVPGHVYEVIAFNAIHPGLDKKMVVTLTGLVNQAEAILDKIPQTTPDNLYESLSALQDALLATSQKKAP